MGRDDATSATSTITITPLQKALQSFVNGALSGMIAAACTTPFDVVKTRRQQIIMGSSSSSSSSRNITTATKETCEHFGAKEVRSSSSPSTLVGTMRYIVKTEGIVGL